MLLTRLVTKVLHEFEVRFMFRFLANIIQIINTRIVEFLYKPTKSTSDYAREVVEKILQKPALEKCIARTLMRLQAAQKQGQKPLMSPEEMAEVLVAEIGLFLLGVQEAKASLPGRTSVVNAQELVSTLLRNYFRIFAPQREAVKAKLASLISNTQDSNTLASQIANFVVDLGVRLVYHSSTPP